MGRNIAHDDSKLFRKGATFNDTIWGRLIYNNVLLLIGFAGNVPLLH